MEFRFYEGETNKGFEMHLMFESRREKRCSFEAGRLADLEMSFMLSVTPQKNKKKKKEEKKSRLMKKLAPEQVHLLVYCYCVWRPGGPY